MKKNARTYPDPETLLKELGITNPSEIDIEAIAYYCGVMIKYRSLVGCEASIIGTTEKAIITIDSKTRFERQRFSIGHELGHWMFDRGNGAILKQCQREDIGSDRSYNSKHVDPEKRANAYAANLLMPSYLFTPLASNLDMTLDSASCLADQFQTSLSATAIRLIEADILPAMLVCFSKNKREWYLSGPSIPKHFYPLRKLDEYCGAYEILHNIHKRKSKPTLVSADTWIDKPNADDYEIIEQSIKITEDKVLSMLWWKNEIQLENESNP